MIDIDVESILTIKSTVGSNIRNGAIALWWDEIVQQSRPSLEYDDDVHIVSIIHNCSDQEVKKRTPSAS